MARSLGLEDTIQPAAPEKHPCLRAGGEKPVTTTLRSGNKDTPLPAQHVCRDLCHLLTRPWPAAALPGSLLHSRPSSKTARPPVPSVGLGPSPAPLSVVYTWSPSCVLTAARLYKNTPAVPSVFNPVFQNPPCISFSQGSFQALNLAPSAT